MLNQSKFVSNGAADNGQAAACSRTHSNGAYAACATSQLIANAAAAMTDGDASADNAAPAASQAAATATNPLAGAAAASAISGRKRAAESRDSVSAAPAAAAASSLSTESLQQSDAAEQSQNKKQRGESSSQASSAAAAASSVGFELLSSASAAAASPSVSPIGVRSGGPINAAQSARSVAAVDDAKESQSAASSASASSSSESLPAQLDFGQQELQRICDEAQRLIRGALSFADAEVHRSNPAIAAAVKAKMQELAEAEAELRSIPANGMEEHANQRAVKQAQLEKLTEWLSSRSAWTRLFRIIDDARAAAQDLHAITHLAALCNLLVVVVRDLPLQPAAQQEVFRRWLLRVDELFTRLCAAAPLMRLSQEQAHDLLVAARTAGALQLIPVLMQTQPSSEFPPSFMGGEPSLSFYCLNSRRHVVCLEPYLRLFEYGLDPTLTKAGGNPLSALQLARNYVRDHPLPDDVAAANPMSEMQTAVDESRELDNGTVPSVLAAFVIHQWRPLGAAETLRRAGLHARFMHALVSSWIAHSTKVRALLLDAAPGRLIPPLVDIVSRYLDLEGVPPERPAVSSDDPEGEREA